MLCCYLKKPATARIAGYCVVENQRFGTLDLHRFNQGQDEMTMTSQVAVQPEIESVAET
jgi:hypothetical protein